MRTSLLLLAIFPAATLQAADEGPKSSAREGLKARIAEDAQKPELKKTPPQAAAAPAVTPPPNAATGNAKPASSNVIPNPPAAKETPTVLPKVEVRKDRVTELDVKLAQQERDIEREKKNMKSSGVDDALNDAKLARPLAIFGGDSTQFRKGVASERVELMEAEKDIMEAMAHTKSKEEKAALQKQLDELRAMRRQLDKSAR